MFTVELRKGQQTGASPALENQKEIEMIDLPQEGITAAWGRAMVAYLGGDPSPIADDWCWSDFAQQYPKLLEPFELYIERATPDNPGMPEAAQGMCEDFHSSREWAEAQIERANGFVPSV